MSLQKRKDADKFQIEILKHSVHDDTRLPWKKQVGNIFIGITQSSNFSNFTYNLARIFKKISAVFLIARGALFFDGSRAIGNYYSGGSWC